MQTTGILLLVLLAGAAGAFVGATAFPVTRERVEIVAADPAPDGRSGAEEAPPAPMLRGNGGATDDELQDILAALARIEAVLEERGELTRKTHEGLKPLIDAIAEVRPGSFRRNLLSARLDANETAAIATLRNIVSAQAQFQQSARADQNGDGVGEYGGFVELSGGGLGRMRRPLIPPVLSGAFRVLDTAGAVSRSGYFFRVYLPDGRGRPIGEPQTGFGPDLGIDVDLAATTWCAYAWPVDHDTSGGRTFFTSQSGDVLATEDRAYSGQGGAPAADAAFVDAGFITGLAAVGRKGADGNTWVQVN